MYLNAVIVEQLEADGRIKRFTMDRSPAHQLSVAFPDEFKGERSGPFFFPNHGDEEIFKRNFADCRVLTLSKQSFKTANGDYSLRIERGGILTTRESLSYYSLSLPEFAIPSEVTLKDAHSNKELYKAVAVDKSRKCFVIYVECPSENGVFDFLLEVEFRIEKDKFPGDEYKDAYLSRHGRQLSAYKRLLPPDQRDVAEKFLAEKLRLSQTSANSPFPALEVASDNGTCFANEGDLTDLQKRGKHCLEVVEEAKRIREMSGRGMKMFEIKQEHSDYRIWNVVSSLSQEDQALFEHPNRWGAPVVLYTLGLLGKSYAKSWLTIRDWTKAYKSRSKPKK